MLFRTGLLTSSLALAVCGAMCGGALAQGAAGGKPMMTLQMPMQPEPARVTLEPAKTAILLLDFVDPICKGQAKCTGQMLPAAAALVAQARKAGVTVAYGTRDRTMEHWMPEVAPMPGDLKIINTVQDRFYNTDLEKDLKAKGITTIIMAGWKVSGSMAYTSVGAMIRGFTVVVPVDATAASSDYETTIGFYELLNGGNANLANQPLKANSVTLSRTDLISFK